MVQENSRIEAFNRRREDLRKLSDEQLKERFWDLCGQVVQPMVAMAKSHTTPAIERSVLLRMGFDSLAAKALVQKIFEAGLLGKGAGHVVLKVAERRKLDLAAAAHSIVTEKGALDGLFREK